MRFRLAVLLVIVGLALLLIAPQTDTFAHGLGGLCIVLGALSLAIQARSTP